MDAPNLLEFGQVFYTHILSPDNEAAAASWLSLASDIWQIGQMALEVPAMALPVAMCLYNFFWPLSRMSVVIC